MSIFYKRIPYRGFIIVPRKTLSGMLDCKIYRGHRNPETKARGKRMRDLCGESLEDVQRQIDNIWYDGEPEIPEDQTRMEDFK